MGRSVPKPGVGCSGPTARAASRRDPERELEEGAVKYLCLVYADERVLDALSESAWDALVRENLDLCDELRRSGHYVSASPLDRVGTAVTVRVRDGKRLTTDGPFAETKEQLGGYYLIEARDLDEAVQVAGRIPGARFGSIEVRPLRAHDPREPWARPRAAAAG
jgi:hypothetical protein